MDLNHHGNSLNNQCVTELLSSMEYIPNNVEIKWFKNKTIITILPINNYYLIKQIFYYFIGIGIFYLFVSEQSFLIYLLFIINLLILSRLYRSVRFKEKIVITPKEISTNSFFSPWSKTCILRKDIIDVEVTSFLGGFYKYSLVIKTSKYQYRNILNQFITAEIPLFIKQVIEGVYIL